MTTLQFPRWNVLPSRGFQLKDENWMEWLELNRAELLRSGELEKIRRDPLRCPVNARFVLSTNDQ